MRHEPFGGISTNELICLLLKRFDGSDSLFALLALMVEMSDRLSINKRCRWACTLRDAADRVEEGLQVPTCPR
jgi:hypothetical protein